MQKLAVTPQNALHENGRSIGEEAQIMHCRNEARRKPLVSGQEGTSQPPLETESNFKIK